MTMYDKLTPEEQERLLTSLIDLVARQKPVPKQLAQQFPPQILAWIVEILEQLKAQGLVGPQTRTQDRLLAITSIINKMGEEPSVGPDSIVDNAKTTIDSRGIPQDDQKTFEWFFNAAKQGLAEAQCFVGDAYRHGRGVRQDYEKAFEWYFKAAEQGDASAQNNVGAMYHNGQGIGRDYEKAFEWYTKAAEQGHVKAKSNRDRMYRARCQGGKSNSARLGCLTFCILFIVPLGYGIWKLI